MDDLRTARPDYEAMYEKLMADHSIMREKYNMEKGRRIELECEKAILQAQVDIVHLIFGK